MNWISVTDRVPENDENVVFVLRSGKRCFGYFNPKETYWPQWTDRGNFDISDYESTGPCVEYDRYHTKDITHWMPLPEPPK